MKCLVTGGAGFVGRHFVKRLCDDGYDVTVVDDYSTGLPVHDWSFQPKTKMVLRVLHVDVRSFFKWDVAGTYDLIIHCAAVIGSRSQRDNNPLAVGENLAIDSDFFRWCVADLKHLSRKVVYFSSSAAYPTMLQTRECNCALSEPLLDFSVNRIGIPDQMYGWGKMTGEYLAQYAARPSAEGGQGLNVVIYRPQSGYGEDQSLDYPLPSIVQRVVNREDPITIWGSGEQSRDFIHIDDIVECVLQTKDQLAPGEVLNLGSGEPTTFNQLAVKAVACASGFHPALNNDLTKPEGTFARYADITKMSRFYVPKVSLAQGIERVYRHLSAAGGRAGKPAVDASLTAARKAVV